MATNAEEPPGKQRGKRAFPAAVVIAPLLMGIATWGAFTFFGLLRAPVSVPRPHDYEAALQNVLRLQDLAVSEAERGEKAFFVSHIGCSTPEVWQDTRFLENVKRMDENGVDVKLIMGLTGSSGQRHRTNWPEYFAKRLDEDGVRPGDYAIKDRELPCHSVVAGSMRNPRAYICLPRGDNIYPTEYLIITHPTVCLEWKQYLLNAFETAKQDAVRRHQ